MKKQSLLPHWPLQVRDSVPRFLLFWLLAGLCEFPFWELFFWPESSTFKTRPEFAASLHGFAALLMFFSKPKGEGWLHPLRKGCRTFVFLTLFLPPVGWLNCLVLYYFGIHVPLPSLTWEEDNPAVKKKEMTTLSEKTALSKKERLAMETDIAPLADLIQGEGDAEIRRSAIENLSQIRNPEAIDLLLELRADPSAEIRFYATSALTRIKKDFDEELDAAKMEMKKDVYKVSARIFLAKTYLHYARSHLLDEATAYAYEREALYHLRYAATTPFANEDDFWLMFEIYRSHGEWYKALDTLVTMELREKSDHATLILARCETLFRLGRYGEMKQALEKLQSIDNLPQDKKAAIAWWGIA